MTANSFATGVLGTVAADLTDTPVLFNVTDIDPAAPTTFQWLARIYANSNFHLRVDGQPATIGDFPQEAGRDGIVLSVAPGGSVSVVKAAGADDGRVWISRIKRL